MMRMRKEIKYFHACWLIPGFNQQARVVRGSRQPPNLLVEQPNVQSVPAPLRHCGCAGWHTRQNMPNHWIPPPLY
jgi:hypothetical protein